MDWLLAPDALIGLLTLTILEIVLGIDNIIFISVLAAKVKREEQARARQLGLAGAFVTRVLLLLSISWIMGLSRPLITVLDRGITGRDLILLAGGLFLIFKATREIHHKFEEGGDPMDDAVSTRVHGTLVSVVAQIMLIDIVFSIDSVVTAVGMIDDVRLMIAANVIALAVMLAAAGPIGAYVERHPTIKMLALSFLVLIGTNLVAEGTGFHIPKGYTYFAMGFSVLVEM
nr:TerC family protein [Gemmatimonadaceae bacterium]